MYSRTTINELHAAKQKQKRVQNGNENHKTQMKNENAANELKAKSHNSEYKYRIV